MSFAGHPAGPQGDPAVKMRSLALAILALIGLATCAVAQKDREKPKGPVYKTPQAAFEAMEKAKGKQDFKALVACYTPKAQAEQAFLLGALFAEGRAKLLSDNDD